MRTGVIAIATLVASCDGSAARSDATEVDSPKECWPDIPRTARGSATLGTGRDGYEPMPDVLPLEYGVQDGYNFVAHVRMSGLVQGNPQDVLHPSNPRTRIRAYFDDTNVPLNETSMCPFRVGYVPTGDGDYVLAEALGIIFDTCWRSDNLIGKRFRIELELLDRDGGFTTDTKVVTAGAPLGPYPMETGSPGCPQ